MKRSRKSRRVRRTLKRKDLLRARQMLSGGQLSVRVTVRLKVLLALHKGKTLPETAEALDTGATTPWQVWRRYRQGGFERAVFDAPRPGGERRLNKKQEERVVALACSAPPAGHSRWSTTLLAIEARRRGIVDRVGRETIRLVLKHHGLKPWREKNVVRA